MYQLTVLSLPSSQVIGRHGHKARVNHVLVYYGSWPSGNIAGIFDGFIRPEAALNGYQTCHQMARKSPAPGLPSIFPADRILTAQIYISIPVLN